MPINSGNSTAVTGMVSGYPNVTNVSPVMQQMQALLSGLNVPLNTAIGNAQSDLQGNLSPSLVRSANAMFGAKSGLAPGSEFLRNRGFDLYNTGSNALKQQGQQNILSLLSGIGGAYTPLAGMQSQENIAGMNNAQRQSEANMQNWLGTGNLALQFMKEGYGVPGRGPGGGTRAVPSWMKSYLF